MGSEEEMEFRHSRGYRMSVLVREPAEVRDPLLHVFFHGQLDRAAFVPPVYHRRNTSTRLGAVCLFVSDPVLYFDEDSSIGWYLLGDDEFWPALARLTGRSAERPHRVLLLEGLRVHRRRRADRHRSRARPAGSAQNTRSGQDDLDYWANFDRAQERFLGELKEHPLEYQN